MAIILQVDQNKVKPLSIKLALLLLVSFFPSSLIAVTCTGGNILNGIQPNLGLVSALQNTSTSGAAIIDGRTLSIPTNIPCSGSGCFTIDATVTTLELKNFLTSLGYGQDRWKFNSAGPPGMDSGATFKSWQALKGYADPFLIGYWDVGCGSDVSIISSTRPLNATTMIIIQELFNPNSIKRCAWGAIYAAYPYWDGFASMVEDYNASTDKLAWTNALLQKIKQYYGATGDTPAGRLIITMTPNTATVEPILKTRKAIKADNPQLPSARTQDIQIDIAGPAGSVPNAQVTATLEMFPGAETFDGHDHGINGRPISTLGTLSPVQMVNGKYQMTYSSSIYASKAQIRVTATDTYSQCTGELVSAPFIAQVSGLQPISSLTLSGNNRLVGGVCSHHGPSDTGTTQSCQSPDNNHYLRATSLSKLNKLQQAWVTTYVDNPKYGYGSLRINDASLLSGGAFEATTSGLWGSDAVLGKRGHKTHRRGVDVDIGVRDTANINSVTKKRLIKLNDRAGSTLFRNIKDETDKFHMHVYLE